jgi:hypothetical protein
VLQAPANRPGRHGDPLGHHGPGDLLDQLSWELPLWGLLAGFLLGLATELVLEVAGG